MFDLWNVIIEKKIIKTEMKSASKMLSMLKLNKNRSQSTDVNPSNPKRSFLPRRSVSKLSIFLIFNECVGIGFPWHEPAKL